MENNLIKDILSLNNELKELEILDNINNLEDIEEQINNPSIDLNVNYPYIIFDTYDLLRTINLCNKLILQKSNNFSYNSISLVPVLEYKTLYFYVTNELSHFRYRTELLGDVNEMLNEYISIPLITLQKLVKLMGNKVLIYKKDNNYYLRLQNGDLLLDVYKANENIIFFPSEPDLKLLEIPVSNLGNIVDAMLPLLNYEISSENKRINFTEEKAYFNSSSYYIESNINTPKLSLSLKDAEFISKLNKYYKNDNMILFNTKSTLPRLFIKLDKIEYEFINSINSISKLLTDQINTSIKPIEATLNYLDLYKVVNLATNLPSSTGNIKLKYKDNFLIISITSAKGDSNFSIPIEKISNNLYKDEIIIRATLLKKLLLSFTKSENINIALNNISITIENDFSKAILMTNN